MAWLPSGRCCASSGTRACLTAGWQLTTWVRAAARTAVALVLFKQEGCSHRDTHAATAGVQRFRVLRVIEQAPVLMCEVELLEDEDDSGEEVRLPGAADDVWLPCASRHQPRRRAVQLLRLHVRAIPGSDGGTGCM